MYANDGHRSGVGGGSTDFRWTIDDVYARLLVAGGGGGGVDVDSGKGGFGGGIVGGGAGGGPTGAEAASRGRGKFFDGGNGFSAGSTGGGGGGWYGGNAAATGGGGGSGYVYTSGTASQYPSGCKLTSAQYLSNAQTIAGNQSFPSPGGNTETGHSGDGYARITLVE